MKVKSTKKALIASLLMLAICFTSLVGTTFAWFTDSVSSSGNKIVAGTLDVDLVDAAGNSMSGKMINWDLTDGDTRTQDQIYWEPGCTYKTEPVKVANKGNLAIKYVIAISGIDGDAKLLEAIEWTVTVGGVKTAIEDLKGSLVAGTAGNPTYSDEIVLSGHMKEEAGNEYMGLTIEGISISVLATQFTAESDSFNNQYDAGASFSTYASGSAVVLRDANGKVLGVSDTETDSMGDTKDDAGYVYMREKNSDNLMGSIYIPSAGIADDATSVDVVYQVTATNPNFTVDAGYMVTTYDITVTGIKNDPALGNVYKVEMNVGAGLGDDNNVKVYHEVYRDGALVTELITDGKYYNNSNGELVFNTTSFSAFNVVYNGVVVPPTSSDLPSQDKIVSTDDVAKYEKVNLQWSSFGPVSALPHGYQLQSTYKFKAPADVSDSIYKDWFCDYYVSVDKEVKEGTIVLGGNYGTFGWVGFENPVDVPANTYIPLLGFFANPENPAVDVMTYEQVVALVGEFICGVSYLEESVAGTKFTVELRLTNPENYDDYKTAAKIEYTFGEGGLAPMDVVENAKDPTVFVEDIAE